MTERYFKVRNESGAYIDNLYYAKDEVVPLDVAKGKEPLWGIEVDAEGNEIGKDRTGVVQKKLSNALANQIAGSNGQGKAKDDDDEGKGSGTPTGLTDVQKEQVKEALGLLDHANKDHWTARGLPNTETISGLVGFAVERKDINEIAPDVQRQEPEKK